MASSKDEWRQITDTFDIDTNQKFYLADKDGIDRTTDYFISDQGVLMYIDENKSLKQASSQVIQGLISGSLAIYTNYRPQFGELYYFLLFFPLSMDLPEPEVMSMTWRNCCSDFFNYSIGNAFRTPEEACQTINVENVKKKYREMHEAYYKA